MGGKVWIEDDAGTSIEKISKKTKFMSTALPKNLDNKEKATRNRFKGIKRMKTNCISETP